VTSLISDPPLHQEPFGGSSIETPGELVILDEQTSELENTCGGIDNGCRRG